ncbi:RNA polymerase sigma factor [Kordiimonas sp.]|uniref:RNA polymerase sigma factor n=1 Tax=Kordiimonas sp. TaxID=1970157 RepID=UPI003A939A12
MQCDPDMPESDLIKNAAEGDHAAFRELVRRHESAVANTVFGMLGRCEEAEDVGQETMVRLYRSLDRFRGEASVKTYVTRIAINLCVDALRRRKRRSWQFWRSDDDDEIDIADPRDTHEDAERRQGIARALNTLTPEFRSVVIMRLVHGHSTDDVADILQIPTGTVLSRLARAKKQLAKELEDYIDG